MITQSSGVARTLMIEEAERLVLASVLLKPELLAGVALHIRVADFSCRRHQLVYQAMLDLYANESDIDLRLLQSHMQAEGTFEEIGGMGFLAGLDLDLPDIDRAYTYVYDMCADKRDRLGKKHCEPPPIIGYACKDETGAWATIGACYMSKEDALATLANMVPGERFTFSEIHGDIPGPPVMQTVATKITPCKLTNEE